MKREAKELIQIFTSIDDEKFMKKFLSELLTEAELTDISKRWLLVKELYRGEKQRNIALQHHISLCKITRGAKILKEKHSALGTILEKMRADNKI